MTLNMLDPDHFPSQDLVAPPVTMKIYSIKKQQKRDMASAAIMKQLQTVRQTLGLLPETYDSLHDDAVFVSIDLENIQAFRSGPATGANYQVGIATFDPRDMDLPFPAENCISTHNLVIGTENYEYGARAKYLFGEPSYVDPEVFLQGIKDYIPTDRNLFLVGHDLRGDLDVLENIGFEVQDGRLSGCLDTHKIGPLIFGVTATLRALLSRLKCPHSFLHNARNDAHFTLRALLLLATRKCPVLEGREERLTALEQLARSPIPSMSPYAARKIKKSAANRARKNASRRVQTLSWSEEKKDEIRAERAAKRLERASEVDLFDLESVFPCTAKDKLKTLCV